MDHVFSRGFPKNATSSKQTSQEELQSQSQSQPTMYFARPALSMINVAQEAGKL
jgi:hypothetical protein